MTANCAAGVVIASLGDVFCQKYFPHPTAVMNANAVEYESSPIISSAEIVDIKPRDKAVNESSNSSGSSRSSNVTTTTTNNNNIREVISDSTSVQSKTIPTVRLLLPEWWDVHRTLNICAIRCGVITPFVLKWYPTLIRLSPGTSPLRVLGRIAIDQAVGSPACLILVFIANSLLQMDNFDQFLVRLQGQFALTWWRGFQYWPFIHAINFGFIPLVYQPLFATICSVYWNAVLSYYTTVPQGKTDHSTVSYQQLIAEK
jgi:hypothetical protein